MRRGVLIVVLALPLAASLSACSSCSGDDASGPDGGTDTNSDTGTDTGTDADADSDTDTDTGTDTDTDTMPEGFVPDAGPWVWKDLPDAGDCGADGCRQLTFVDEVRQLEWDVWGNLLAYNDGDTFTATVVNYYENKQLTIPNAFPSIGIGPSMGSSEYYPATVFENLVCYSRAVFQDPDFSDVICANLGSETQHLVYHRPKEGTDFPNPANDIDVYNNRIVSMGGCGEVMDSWPLCAFDMEAPGTYQEIAPHQYGSYNSMWGDVVVWTTGLADNGDIRGYDFSAGSFIEITDDARTQLAPRIHENRVVYMDLKLGDSGPMGDWNHAAIFMHDLATHETIQITSGEWIASFPDIHENIIVWMDYRACGDPNNKDDFSCTDVWGYNLDTSTEFQVTDIPSRVKATPRIWGDKVFLDMAQTTTGTTNAIYMFDLPEGAK